MRSVTPACLRILSVLIFSVQEGGLREHGFTIPVTRDADALSSIPTIPTIPTSPVVLRFSIGMLPSTRRQEFCVKPTEAGRYAVRGGNRYRARLYAVFADVALEAACPLSYRVPRTVNRTTRRLFLLCTMICWRRYRHFYEAIVGAQLSLLRFWWVSHYGRFA